MSALASSARWLWTWLRAVSGDSAYDTYARRQRALANQPLSRRAFYLERLERRYSTITRCC
jgi:uncharacterized short protein YbdD (DUF466 family)